MKMIWTPLAPFGSEVADVDLDHLTTEDINTIRLGISRSRVVVFRDQTIGDAGLVHFLGALGPLTFTDGETPVADAPDLNVVSNLGRTTPPRSVFHTDTSYVEQPPMFTALRPVLLPSSGGCTEFTDQVAVVARLGEPMRSMLAGRTILHRSSGLPSEGRSTRHSVLCSHPTTGEVALYLSTPERCSDLSGLDENTSDRVIQDLYRKSTEFRFIYRHHWREGDILIWDDRLTMHRADHGDVSGDRVLHRGLVRGGSVLPAYVSV